MKIVVSSGHSLYVRGAAGPEPWGLDEVNEARRVVAEVADWLTINGYDVSQIHDDVSKTQSDNLNYLVREHNKFASADRLDLSLHFNAYVADENAGRGVEALWVSEKGQAIAIRICKAVASVSGLINRGDKYRSDLYWLNGTTGSLGACLVETCFCDAGQDCEAYRQHMEEICAAIANAITAEEEDYAPLPFHA